MAKLTMNEKVLKAVKVNEATIAWFQPWLERWPNAAGAKPTPEMLMAAAQFSTRGAGRESGYVALQLREGGCSVFEHGQAFDCGPAKVHTKALTDAGYFERSTTAHGDGRSLRFSLTFTDKGTADLYRRLGLAANGKPVKPIKPAKAAVKVTRKGNAKVATVPAAVETPTSEAPSVTEGTPEHVTPEQFQALAAQFSK